MKINECFNSIATAKEQNDEEDWENVIFPLAFWSSEGSVLSEGLGKAAREEIPLSFSEESTSGI